jgi:hypothetical protein
MSQFAAYLTIVIYTSSSIPLALARGRIYDRNMLMEKAAAEIIAHDRKL